MSSALEQTWDKWGNNFSGKMHCEAMFGCLRSLKFDDPELTQQMSKKHLNDFFKKKFINSLRTCEPDGLWYAGPKVGFKSRPS